MTQRKPKTWTRGTKKGYSLDGEVSAMLDSQGWVCLQLTDSEGRTKMITIGPDQQDRAAQVLCCAIKERRGWGHNKRR